MTFWLSGLNVEVLAQENSDCSEPAAEKEGIHCYEQASSSKNIVIEEKGISVSTTADESDGFGFLLSQAGTGDMGLRIDRSTIMTTGARAVGVYGQLTGSGGDAGLLIKSSSIITEGDGAQGVFYADWGTTGLLNINIIDSSISTSGESWNDGLDDYYAHAIYGYHWTDDATNTKDSNINVRGSSLITSGETAHGIYSFKEGGIGHLNIWISSNSKIETSGASARGVYGLLQSSSGGKLNIQVSNSRISTSGELVSGVSGAHGIWGYVYAGDGGDLNIELLNSRISTSGEGAYGVYGRHNFASEGEIKIQLSNSRISTSGEDAYGIYGYHQSFAGDLLIRLVDSTVTTSEEGAYGVYGRKKDGAEGHVNIELINSRISTSGASARGVYGYLGNTASTEDVLIRLVNSTITTSGTFGRGVFGWLRDGAGDVRIQLVNSRITTSERSGYGIYGLNQLYAGSGSGEGEGDVDIQLSNSRISTSGENAFGIYGYHLDGSGDILIQLVNSRITTSGSGAHGIYGRIKGTSSRIGTGEVHINLQNSFVHASGTDAFGIYLGSLQNEVFVEGNVEKDSDGYLQQTVTINSEVRGGSGNGGGIFLAGGGRVIIGPNGRVVAPSGIAIKSGGLLGDGNPGAMQVNVMFNGRPIEEVLDGGRIVSGDSELGDVGRIVIAANNVQLYDSDSPSEQWMMNGGYDVQVQQHDGGGVHFQQRLTPRAALYETIPGLLLRLDAGVPVKRPDERLWVQLGHGDGKGKSKRSLTDAKYEYNRVEVVAGLSHDLADTNGSIWLRQLKSEADVDSPNGGGKLDVRGSGIGIEANWQQANNLLLTGRLSYTSYDVGATSSSNGILTNDIKVGLWQARLEASKTLERNNGMKLTPRAWLWHTQGSSNVITDSLHNQVKLRNLSRTVVGGGVRAEMQRTNHLLYGSLDLEGILGGAETTAQILGGEFNATSPSVRVMSTLGAQMEFKNMTLRGELQMSEAGGKNGKIGLMASLGMRF